MSKYNIAANMFLWTGFIALVAAGFCVCNAAGLAVLGILSTIAGIGMVRNAGNGHR